MSIIVHIGKYRIESTDGFATKKEAIQFIQERYPELNLESIEKKIAPLIKKDADKSGNSSEENTESRETIGKVDSKRSERSEARKN